MDAGALAGAGIMTPVQAKLRQARDLIARLEVAHDPVERIRLSRALRVATEELRDAVVARSDRANRGKPESPGVRLTGQRSRYSWIDAW